MSFTDFVKQVGGSAVQAGAALNFCTGIAKVWRMVAYEGVETELDQLACLLKATTASCIS